MRLLPYCVVVVAGALVGFGPSAATAAVPSDLLLPATTKGYLSIPSVETLETEFDKTQWGQLLADPVMKPFAEDLKRQLRNKWSKNHEKLGLVWEDIRGVPAGEVGMAKVLLGPDRAATALVADVTGKLADARALLDKVHANLTAKRAVRTTRDEQGRTLIIYTHPKKEDQKVADVAVFCLDVKQQQLLAADDLGVALGIVRRIDGSRADSLSTLPAYAVDMERCRRAAGNLKPHLRWFIEPFGFADVQRITRPDSRHTRGQDLVEIFRKQGFTCIQGAGGYVNFADGTHDILHRTMVYAPAVKREPGDKSQDKFRLAARMLNFPNGGDHLPPSWVPRDLATFVSFNGDLRKGFEYSKTLVNAFADDEVFEEVLRSLEKDPQGPQVNIRKELVAHLGQRVMVLSDYELPITPKCERLLLAIELTKVDPVSTAIRKLMENDPNRIKRRFGQHTVWDTAEEKAEEPKLKLDVDFGQPVEHKAAPQAKKNDKKALASKAICVAHGCILVSTHAELIGRVLEETDARLTLAGSVDYQMVRETMLKLGATNNCCQTFSRTDEEYRPTYELLRSGQMPQSETLLGKFLNSILKEDGDEDEEEVKLRQQQIDARKLPEYERVRRYLGPAGIYVDSLDDGWFATGFFLSKQSPRLAERP